MIQMDVRKLLGGERDWIGGGFIGLADAVLQLRRFTRSVSSCMLGLSTVVTSRCGTAKFPILFELSSSTWPIKALYSGGVKVLTPLTLAPALLGVAVVKSLATGLVKAAELGMVELVAGLVAMDSGLLTDDARLGLLGDSPRSW